MNFKFKFYISLNFIIYIWIYNLTFKDSKDLKDLKVCLCSIGKKENLYAREFVEHYKSYRIDKIFIYDNNDINDEKFEEVINDYINIKFVEIINIRGLKSPQIKMYNHCYKNNKLIYDWFIFFDMDEFIFLNNIYNIKSFLIQKKFNKCQRIQLNWVMHSDNNKIYYENKSLFERFPERENNIRGKIVGGQQGIKSIIRGNLNINITCPHIINKCLISCDGFGRKKKIENIITSISDLKYYYIDHFYSKSTEEFINKLFKGSVSDINAFNKSNLIPKLNRIKVYFSISKITLLKIQYIENKTHINLSYYKNNINNILL